VDRSFDRKLKHIQFHNQSTAVTAAGVMLMRVVMLLQTCVLLCYGNNHQTRMEQPCDIPDQDVSHHDRALTIIAGIFCKLPEHDCCQTCGKQVLAREAYENNVTQMVKSCSLPLHCRPSKAAA